MASPEIEQLIKVLAKLPGLGPRSGRRAVLQMLKHRESLLLPLLSALEAASDAVQTCEVCGNLDGHSPCDICRNESRDKAMLCVVEDVSDLWALERAAAFRGRYHVLGGVLSAIDGVGPEDLSIVKLIERASAPEVSEIVIATNATVDGQTTAHYITERLKAADVSVSRLAHGVPVGGELDFLDDGTLAAALKARRPF